MQNVFHPKCVTLSSGLHTLEENVNMNDIANKINLYKFYTKLVDVITQVPKFVILRSKYKLPAIMDQINSIIL